jgi:hypothetical protein
MPDSPIQFPTLDNGMIAQLPVRLNIETITRETRFPDGSVVAANAEARLKYTWTLQYDNLNDAEWQRFMDFVATTHRGAVSFVFPDPIGNLLAQSGNLEHSIWLASPGLTVDPFEDPAQAKAFIITNPTAQPLQLSQTVSLEGAFRTCFSVLAKWDGGAGFEMGLTDGLGATSQLEVAGQWTKHYINLVSRPEAQTRTATITIPPTTQIIVSSPQLEISIAPGAYLETGAAGCIFADSWLAQQAYESRTNAPGAHAITLRIESFRSI